MESEHMTEMERYERQILFLGIGEVGQRKLLQAKAVIVGCGALGTVIANTLARAGVGHLAIADIHSGNIETLIRGADVVLDGKGQFREPLPDQRRLPQERHRPSPEPSVPYNERLRV